jgi:hypothetical protein
MKTAVVGSPILSAKSKSHFLRITMETKYHACNWQRPWTALPAERVAARWGLRLSYSSDLKTNNNCGLGNLGKSCHSVWVGDSQER